MAGQVSERELGNVLMQAMLGAKNIRAHCDRLLHIRHRLEQLSLSPGGDHADRIKELASDLHKVYFIDLEAGALILLTCLRLAAKGGARHFSYFACSGMTDEQLHEALVAQELPSHPTTQTEAFSRVEATLMAVKVLQNHHIPHCIGHLVGERPPTLVTDYSYNGLVKTDLWDMAPAAAIVDLDKARDYLDHACTLADLAVEHIDLAVVVISSFLDPNEVASISDFTDRTAYISEEGPYPSD